ncbi:MAG: heparan-alpha-glucosaminide N-acetyltransferase domain-containing protein [Candidatus Micrarchaeota archaeon]
MRIKAIDTFRGLSILLMVFFTIILGLCSSLPWLLTHNVPGTLRPGDFVLPMFLFASGMSLVYFDKKKSKNKDYILDIIERIGKLVMIWFFLSPISSGEFLGMDEIMLNVLLFMPTLLLIKFSNKEIIIAGLSVFLLYFALQVVGFLPDFNANYLGGYGAAIFYLPVMLAGVIAGREIENIDKYITPLILFSVIMLILIPPYKLMVTPSFIILSILVSLLFFKLSKKIDIKEIEYLGKDPIRYWVLMFVVLGLPLLMYADGLDIGLPLKLDWLTAIGLTIVGMVILYMLSKILDIVISITKKHTARG